MSELATTDELFSPCSCLLWEPKPTGKLQRPSAVDLNSAAALGPRGLEGIPSIHCFFKHWLRRRPAGTWLTEHRQTSAETVYSPEEGRRNNQEVAGSCWIAAAVFILKEPFSSRWKLRAQASSEKQWKAQFLLTAKEEMVVRSQESTAVDYYTDTDFLLPDSNLDSSLKFCSHINLAIR